ncbi:hypothetical protein [Antrihabitans spumae]|uniref:Uncharacterized protein n=1 Tax=Antrihabitans spumae TaxID=3373370 RepID=A0ABW7JX37_9NOCA
MPKLDAWYQQRAGDLTPKGVKIVQRAVAKGSLAGDAACRILFEPAMLIGPRATVDELYELAVICREIPFTGDYGIWDPVRAALAVAYRGLTMTRDTRAIEVEQYLSFAENGERPGPPVTSGAMANRLNGSLMATFRREFVSPMTLPVFSYLIEKQRELMIIWSFGGSHVWPRERVDSELAVCADLLQDYFKK